MNSRRPTNSWQKVGNWYGKITETNWFQINKVKEKISKWKTWQEMNSPYL